MIGMAMSQFEGLRPSMGGSVILTHWAAAVRAEGRVRLWLLVERVIRLTGGLLMVRDEMGREWRRREEKRTVGRRMAGWS